MRILCSYCGGREELDIPGQPEYKSTINVNIMKQVGPHSVRVELVRYICDKCVERSGMLASEYIKLTQANDPFAMLSRFDELIGTCDNCKHINQSVCPYYPGTYDDGSTPCSSFEFKDPCVNCRGAAVFPVQSNNGKQFNVCIACGGKGYV